jgi:MFS family permease
LPSEPTCNIRLPGRIGHSAISRLPNRVGLALLVLASLRRIWNFDVKMVGTILAIDLCGYLVGSLFCGFVAGRFGREKTILKDRNSI